MPIIDIPVEFEWEGICFQGSLSTSKGNEHVWQLNLNRYHYGQLVNYESGWKWCPQDVRFFSEPFMEDFFIRTVQDFLASGSDIEARIV